MIESTSNELITENYTFTLIDNLFNVTDNQTGKCIYQEKMHNDGDIPDYELFLAGLGFWIDYE